MSAPHEHQHQHSYTLHDACAEEETFTVSSMTARRRRRHFKSGRATANKRRLGQLLQAAECAISLAAARRIYACVFSNTWVPMQSGNETNDPLKSGPAKAGPAGPATPPLVSRVPWSRRQSTCMFKWPKLLVNTTIWVLKISPNIHCI